MTQAKFPVMLDEERAKYVTREIKYEQEIESMRKQLANREAQIVMLRELLPSYAPTDNAPIAIRARTCASFHWWRSSRGVFVAIPLQKVLLGGCVGCAECGSNPNAPCYDPADKARAFPE